MAGRMGAGSSHSGVFCAPEATFTQSDGHFSWQEQSFSRMSSQIFGFYGYQFPALLSADSLGWQSSSSGSG